MAESRSLPPLAGVPRTLLMTTRARVEEHQRPNGIFRDPKIAQWWPYLQWDPALDAMYTPLAQLSWAVRAHLFDQVVQRHLSANPGAVVVELGAGLSTRYYRTGQNCRCWLDVDLPEVTALRRRLDLESSRHRFIAASALELDWIDAVPVCAPHQLLIVAEGLLMYFDAAQVKALIAQLQEHFQGAALIFDAVGGFSRGRGAKQLAQLGAPLRWFIKNEQDIPTLGISVVEVRSLLQENCRYPQRLGKFRWVPWLSRLPCLRNASLILETQLKP